MNNNNEQINPNPAETAGEAAAGAQPESQAQSEKGSSVFDRFSGRESGESKSKPEKGLGSRRMEKVSQKAREVLNGAREKLKSIKTIEAITDRFAILENGIGRELIEPSRKRLADRETKFESEREAFESKEMAAKKDLENLGNIEGLDMPESMRNKVQREIDKAEKNKEKSEKKRNAAKAEKDQLDEKISGYETRTKEAKGRIAGRIQEKRDKYESKIDRQRQETLLPSMEAFAEKQDKIRSLTEVLAKLNLAEISSPVVEKRRAELVKRTEKALKKEKKEIGKIEKNLKKANRKIEKYQAADKKAFEKQLGLLGVTEEQYRTDNALKFQEREQRLEPQKSRFAAADRKANVAYELSEINSVLNLCLREKALLMNPADFKASADNALAYDMTEKELQNLVFSSEQALSLFEKANQPIASLAVFKDVIKAAKDRLSAPETPAAQPEQQPETVASGAEASGEQAPAPETVVENPGPDSGESEAVVENKPMASAEAVEALNALIASAWAEGRNIDDQFAILADGLVNAADVNRNALGGLAQAANQCVTRGILDSGLAEKIVEVIEAKLKTIE